MGGANTQTANIFDVKVNGGASKLTVASGGQTTIADAVLTTADINGGTLDGVTIGGATAADGSEFTALTVTGDTATEVQLQVTGANTQTANIFDVKVNGGASKLTVASGGQTTIADAV